jgi:hypothetical protein
MQSNNQCDMAYPFFYAYKMLIARRLPSEKEKAARRAALHWLSGDQQAFPDLCRFHP